MLIRILRSTMAAPKGEPVQAVDAGQEIDVEPMAGAQLIACGKAVAVEESAPLTGLVQTPEDALTEMEIRPEPKRSKRR